MKQRWHIHFARPPIIGVGFFILPGCVSMLFGFFEIFILLEHEEANQ